MNTQKNKKHQTTEHKTNAQCACIISQTTTPPPSPPPSSQLPALPHSFLPSTPSTTCLHDHCFIASEFSRSCPRNVAKTKAPDETQTKHDINCYSNDAPTNDISSSSSSTQNPDKNQSEIIYIPTNNTPHRSPTKIHQTCFAPRPLALQDCLTALDIISSAVSGRTIKYYLKHR